MKTGTGPLLRAAWLAFGLAVSGWALAQQPAPTEWTDEERGLLIAAWQHTAGTTAYEYRMVVWDSEQKARVGRMSKWDGTRIKPYEYRTESLVDVDPQLRVALAELYEPQRRSEPVRWLRKSGATHWAVLELVKRGPVQRARDRNEFDAKARRWVAQGQLAAPADLAASAEHRSRAAYWQAVTPDGVKAVPADLSPNGRFGNEMTPLTQALLGSRLDVAEALLARGADTNLCGFWGCPLHIAAGMEDPSLSARAVKLLLGAGARAGQNEARYHASRNAPLNEALRTKRVDTVKALLDAGASPDGAPGVKITPVVAAMLHGSRELVTLLVERGASVLPHDDRGHDTPFGHITVVRMASEGEDKTLLPWAEKLMMDAALKDPRYRWNAHLEQDGKRLPIVDGAELNLKAAPFKLVLTLPPPAHEYGVVLAASTSPRLADEVRQPDRGNGIFIMTRSGALAVPPSEESYELFLYETRPADAKADDRWGGNMGLSVNAQRPDFHEIRAARHEYVREFRSVYNVLEDSKSDEKAVPLSTLKGQRITLALGGFLPTELWVGRLVAPRVVTLVLR